MMLAAYKRIIYRFFVFTFSIYLVACADGTSQDSPSLTQEQLLMEKSIAALPSDFEGKFVVKVIQTNTEKDKKEVEEQLKVILGPSLKGSLESIDGNQLYSFGTDRDGLLRALRSGKILSIQTDDLAAPQ